MTLKQKLIKLQLVVDNIYLNKYIELVNANKARKKQSFITQEHHIIPKYFFRSNNKKVDESKSNKVNLKFSDHLLAHYYLMKCSASTIFELANANAIVKSIDNPHSIDVENWISKNSELLQQVNKRRCELISLHHADVSGSNNPRATTVYKYQDNSVVKYDSIKECAFDNNINADSFRSRLSKNRFCIINDIVYSKYDNISKSEIKAAFQERVTRSKVKRYTYKFICQHCGTPYYLKLSKADYDAALVTKRHFCSKCTKSGIMFVGVAKSTEQKNKMHDAAKDRMQKIECIETGEIFESVKAAKRKYSGDISGCLSGRRKTASGKH